MRRRHPRWPRLRPVFAVAAALAVLGGAGCTGSSDPPSDPPSDAGTPLADVDTTGLVAARTDFCAGLPDAAIQRALGGPATSESSYGSGDRAAITSEVKDVAHEFSCTFVSESKVAARAWVFAPPVSAARARELLADVRRARGCGVPPEAPAFGSPSLATSCESRGRTTVTFRGLFGDAWLSCSVAWPAAEAADAPSAERLDRAGRWCAAVLAAARH